MFNHWDVFQRRDHPAKLLTDTDLLERCCSVCGDAVENSEDGALRHVGEGVPRRILPERADVPAVARAARIAERALTELTWTPHLTNADRAAAVVQALYAAGLVARRPRTPRVRRSPTRLAG